MNDQRADTPTSTELGPTGESILITGGAGFIGSHLAAALAADNDVTVLDNCAGEVPSRLPATVDVRRGDVREASIRDALVAEADIVYHEAALVSVEESLERPAESHGTNVAATVDLLDTARKHGTRVVFASSCAIYGDPTGVPIDETEPASPLSPYAVDKLAADHYVRVYGRQYDFPTVALRYFNVYGPGQRGDYSGVIDAFVERARADEPLEVHGEGDQTRDFVHVSDIVRANLAAAVTPHTGRAYNVGTGRETSIQELAETVRDLVDTDAPITHTDPRPGDISRSRADLTRSTEWLGYEPTVELSDGLKTVLDA
ncbi:NAD-dependent epimerase/dehydratase family protein [Halohasta salina]|uniref:NAD-dependent epimerase/dehydratase family protein n=1 Tax=Halohasta salina TaxID=2961621 RepID=UPI0020A4DE1E|nr:NAD-dependent epimerase/dehydratase family protein [Halohasta salina]